MTIRCDFWEMEQRQQVILSKACYIELWIPENVFVLHAGELFHQLVVTNFNRIGKTKGAKSDEFVWFPLEKVKLRSYTGWAEKTLLQSIYFPFRRGLADWVVNTTLQQILADWAIE